MKIIFFKICMAVSIVISLFSLAPIAHAQNNNYVVLTSLPNTTTGCTDTNGNAANCSTLSQYLPGIFNLVIGLAAVAAFVLLTLYGFEWMTSDSISIKANAKKRLLDICWGLALVIFAYAILYTLNPVLVAGNLDLTPPQSFTAVTAGTVTAGPNGVVGYINTCDGTRPDLCTSETTDRGILASDTGPGGAQLISVQGACDGTKPSGCTNLAGISQMDMTDTVALQQQCNCGISVTGGTEHQANNTLDMSASSGLNQFLTGNNLPPSGGTNVTKTINGQQVTFTYEAPGQVSNVAGGGTVTSTGSHWHVTFPQ